MIEIEVSRILQCSVEEVYTELEDCSSYHEWWPTPVSPVAGADRGVRVRPLPFVHIVMVQTTVKPNKAVRYRYVKGPFRGAGTWEMHAVGNDPSVSEVRYSVRLEPVNYPMKLLSSTSLFRRKHERDISRIMDQLARRCSRDD